jgi:tetratricopeptide (TPR) repeat protein
MTQVASKDFFISYNKADRAWAEWIAWQLEAEGYFTILQAWDFRPGSNFILQMDTAAKAAKRTIAILSPNYFDAIYTQPEWAAALVQDPTGQEGKVLPVRVRECTPRGLFASLVYIDLVGLNTLAAQNTLLAGVHRSRARPSAEPSFPGTTALVATQAPSFPGNWPKIWNVPYKRNLFFTGREKLLDSLHKQLASMEATALTQAAISGLGGIGKTQTALEYAYRYENLYRLVLWVKADTRDTLISDFVTIADMLNLPKKNEQDQMLTVAAVKRWLTENLYWLLILDNADDLDLIRDFLPTRNTGHLLLTTRIQAVGLMAHSIAVEKMDKEEGALFLLRRAKVLAPEAPLTQATEIDRTQAEAIVAAMDGLPLALDQAGAYIEETGCGLPSYLDLYKTHQKDLLQRRGTILSDHPASVATTWSLSFQRIEQANRAAADLLRLCAFLDPDAIPEEIFRDGASDLGFTLMSVAADPFKLDKAIAEVLRYSLMRRNMKEKMLSLHRLVQVVVQAEMNQKMQRQWAERAMRAVNRTLPKIELATLPRGQRLLPHTQVCATLIDQYGFVFPEAAQLLMWTGSYLVIHTEYQKEELLSQRALAVQEQMLGPPRPTTTTKVVSLGPPSLEQERNKEAESLYQRALKIREQVFGPEHPVTAISLNGLGLIYSEQGKYEEAEAHYQQALKIREQVLGPEHLATATSLDNLGRLYSEQGRYKEAESQFERALAIRKQVLVPTHPATAGSLSNLGWLYWQQQHKYQKAEHFFQQALNIYEKVLGSEHLTTANRLSTLGWLYREEGKYKEAELHFQRALAICEQAPEPDDLLRADILHGLGWVYEGLHRYTEAESRLQQALAIRERAQGPNHLGTAEHLRTLGEFYYLRGRYKEAEPLYQRALAIREKALGPKHPDTADIWYSLGDIYRKLGRRKEAEEYYLQGVAVYEQVLGLASPRTGMFLGKIFWQLLRMRRIRQAAPMGVRGLKAYGLKESIRGVALAGVILPAKRFIGRILWKP